MYAKYNLSTCVLMVNVFSYTRTCFNKICEICTKKTIDYATIQANIIAVTRTLHIQLQRVVMN